MYTQEQIDGTEKIIKQGNCSGIHCSRCLGMAKDRHCDINTSDTHLGLVAQIGPKGIKDLTERLAKAKQEMGAFKIGDRGSPAFKVGDRVQRKTGGPTRIRSIFDPNSGRTFEVEMSMPITPKLVYQELYENTKPSTRKAIRRKLLGL